MDSSLVEQRYNVPESNFSFSFARPSSLIDLTPSSNNYHSIFWKCLSPISGDLNCNNVNSTHYSLQADIQNLTISNNGILSMNNGSTLQLTQLPNLIPWVQTSPYSYKQIQLFFKVKDNIYVRFLIS